MINLIPELINYKNYNYLFTFSFSGEEPRSIHDQHILQNTQLLI